MLPSVYERPEPASALLSAPSPALSPELALAAASEPDACAPEAPNDQNPESISVPQSHLESKSPSAESEQAPVLVEPETLPDVKGFFCFNDADVRPITSRTIASQFGGQGSNECACTFDRWHGVGV